MIGGVTYFSGHGDGILGIVHTLLVRETASLCLAVRRDHSAPVQGARLEALYQMEDGEAGPDLLVLEVTDGEARLPGLQPLIGPLDYLGLRHREAGAGAEPGEQGEGVGPHELPDHS